MEKNRQFSRRWPVIPLNLDFRIVTVDSDQTPTIRKRRAGSPGLAAAWNNSTKKLPAISLIGFGVVVIWLCSHAVFTPRALNTDVPLFRENLTTILASSDKAKLVEPLEFSEFLANQTHAWILRSDAMLGFLPSEPDIHGVRMELRQEF